MAAPKQSAYEKTSLQYVGWLYQISKTAGYEDKQPKITELVNKVSAFFDATDDVLNEPPPFNLGQVILLELQLNDEDVYVMNQLMEDNILDLLKQIPNLECKREQNLFTATLGSKTSRLLHQGCGNWINFKTWSEGSTKTGRVYDHLELVQQIERDVNGLFEN